MQRDRTSTLSVEIRLHLKRPATCEWPSRSFKVTVVAAIWYAIYDFPLVFHCKYISILHHFWDINTYLPKNTMWRDLDHTHLGGQFAITRLNFSGQLVHRVWWFSLQPFQRNLKGCKILKMDHVTRATPFSGMLCYLKANTCLQAHKIWRL